MKKLSFIPLAIMACALICGLTACNSDNDDAPKEGLKVDGTLDILGETFNFTNADWHISTVGETSEIVMDFYTFDYRAYTSGTAHVVVPKDPCVVTIHLKGLTDFDEIPEGTFAPAKYYVTVSLRCNPEDNLNPALPLHQLAHPSNRTTDLTIAKDGDKLKVSLPSIELTDDDNTYFASFSWNGSIPKLPVTSQDKEED